MWSYPETDQAKAARSVESVAHLKAHHAYLLGDVERASQLYKETCERLLPKLIAQEGQRPARVLLRMSCRLALYALRAGEKALQRQLWERFALAFDIKQLDQEAIGSLCVLAALTGHASSEQVSEATQLLDESSHQLWACVGLLDETKRSQALQHLRGYLENPDGEGNPRRPWDDDPVIGCYELLHQQSGTSWLATS